MNQEATLQPQPLKHGEGELLSITSIQPRRERGSQYPYWIALVDFFEEQLTVEIRTDDREMFINAGYRSVLKDFQPTIGVDILVMLKWQPIKRRRMGGRWRINLIASDGGEIKLQRPNTSPVVEEPLIILNEEDRIKTWNEDLKKWGSFKMEGDTITMESDLWGKVVWKKTETGYTRQWQDMPIRYYLPKKEETQNATSTAAA